MKFKLFSILLILLTFSGCAMLGDRTVNISEAQLQQKINERLAIPISLLKIFDVSLSNSLVKFDSQTGRMKTTLDTNVTSLLSNKAFAGKLGISGKLRFDPATQSIVLDEPKVESLNLNGLDGKYGDLLNVLAQKLGGDMLNGMALYTVKPEDLRVGSTQYNPKEMLITDKGLQMTFSPVR
ncbi:MAG: DUF1439 domain-containing protein [Methylotenera sp.]